MGEWWLKLVAILLASISGPLREIIIKSVKEWEAKAKETKNQWDDILVGIVKWILLVP